LSTIVHFEIPSDNIERAKKFYNGLFGWKIEKFSGNNENQLTSAATGQPIDYWIVSTLDDKGNKAVGGGLMKRQMPEQQITNYINVTSVDNYSSKVRDLGGNVLSPKHAVPGMGYFVLCQDTEKNNFAIWESDSSAK
jgi:predicted enzyme related to lactoylglutathione lyase